MFALYVLLGTGTSYNISVRVHQKLSTADFFAKFLKVTFFIVA